MWRRLVLLCVGIFEAYLCEKSGSRLPAEVVDRASYWMLFLRLLGMFR